MRLLGCALAVGLGTGLVLGSALAHPGSSLDSPSPCQFGAAAGYPIDESLTLRDLRASPVAGFDGYDALLIRWSPATTGVRCVYVRYRNDRYPAEWTPYFSFQAMTTEPVTLDVNGPPERYCLEIVAVRAETRGRSIETCLDVKNPRPEGTISRATPPAVTGGGWDWGKTAAGSAGGGAVGALLLLTFARLRLRR